jgi:hypothetical protein
MTTQDPWSRPTIDDLRRILESIGKANTSNGRTNARLELSVPAEIRTQRGNTISAMTREISRTGIGMLHRGAVTPGDEFTYNVRVEWCSPCDNGMFMSGGRFLPNASEA